MQEVDSRPASHETEPGDYIPPGFVARVSIVVAREGDCDLETIDQVAEPQTIRAENIEDLRTNIARYICDAAAAINDPGPLKVARGFRALTPPRV
jgi:hypothetical protein